MWIIFLSFLSFCLSATFLLPNYVEEIPLPENYLSYAPFFLMAIALGTQLSALRRMKQLLKAKKIEQDNDSLKNEITTLNEKLHQEKKNLTEFKTKITHLDKELNRRCLEANRAKQEFETKEQAFSKALDNEKKQHATKLSALEAEKASSSEDSDLKLLQFLSLLQESGQFLDFVMDDVSQYPNEQVGAAARIVHQGVKKVMNEYLDVAPLLEQEEGTALELETNEQAHTFRLLGKIGEPPHKGIILHRGWKNRAFRLPEIVDPKVLHLDQNQGLLAPVELELI